MKPKIYLAGPMTGIEDFNHPAFHKAESALSAIGFDVYSPARIDGGETDKPYNYYFRRALRLLLECDHVFFLEGWESSKGARREMRVASWLGMTVLKQRDTTTPVILVIGAGPQVGKTTVAGRLSELLMLPRGTTSDVILPRFLGEHPERTRGDVLADKERYRHELIRIGNEMCEKDPSALAAEMIRNGACIVDGIRRQRELDRVRALYDCIVVWVEREGYPLTADNTDICKPIDAITLTLDDEWR